MARKGRSNVNLMSKAMGVVPSELDVYKIVKPWPASQKTRDVIRLSDAAVQELQEVFKNCDIHKGYKYITLLQIYGRMIVQCGGEMAAGRGHQIIQTGRKTFLMPASHQSHVSGSKVVHQRLTPSISSVLLYEHSKGTAKVLFPSRCQMGKAGEVAEKRFFLAALRKIRVFLRLLFLLNKHSR
ncbi:hypothetical protein H0E87_007047 [Populus deltoides]|uniref:Uncharacterized protein n=1 Tax=Populus deltoides TaxID=3696 RepID=A0A8T2Z9S1_POPDE|nr:hypothetical protein H0E87_007047 [Populus deltoides]